jgi:prepilin-type N-terminal cleavage/methylation domain-containing protein
MRPGRTGRAGFTLIELLVVLAVVGVVLGLLLPGVHKVRASAARSDCTRHLMRLGQAFHSFHQTHAALPTTRVSPVRLYWGPQLLPDLGEPERGVGYDPAADVKHPANRAAVGTRLRVFECPAAPDPGRLNHHFPAGWPAAVADYAGVHGVDESLWRSDRDGPPVLPSPAPDTAGAMRGTDRAGPRRLDELTDGPANTLLLVESAGRPQVWLAGRREPDSGELGQPAHNAVQVCGWAEGNLFNVRGFAPSGLRKGPCGVNCSNRYGVYAFHPAGANGLLADGAVRFLRRDLDLGVLAALCTRAAGDGPAGDW